MLSSYRWRITPALVSILLLTAACSGSQSGSVPQEQSAATLLPAAQTGGPAALALPGPAELLRRASEHDDDNKRFELGYYFEDQYPNQHVDFEVEGDDYYARFEPEQNLDTPELAPGETAFAIYRFFDLDNYSGPPRFRTAWRDTAALAADRWVGFSDFSRDRWVWRQAPEADGELLVPQIPSFLSPDGDLFVVILVTGSEPAELSWLLYGDNFFELYFAMSENQGTGSLAVDFDVSENFGYGGETLQLDFDFEGDGVYELQDIQTPTFSHTYSTHGSYHPTLRASDEDGAVETYTRDVLVINPNNDPPVAALSANKLSGDAPLLVTLDASLSSDPDGEIISYEWEFDGSGAVFDRETTEPATVWSFGKAGVNTVRLRVTDNDLATTETELDITLGTGWHHTTIDSDITFKPEISIAMCGILLGTRLCATYYDEDDGELRFARASSTDCSDWSDPLVLDTSAMFSMHPSIRNIDEHPAIAYAGDNGAGSQMLCFMQAANKTGTAWPAPTIINAAIAAKPVLGFSATKPAIINGEAGIDEALDWYTRNADDTTWASPVRMAQAPPSGVDLIELEFAYAAGAPMALFSTKLHSADIYQLNFVRADDGEGADWGEQVDVSGELTMDFIGGGAPTPALAVIDGAPAFAYCGAEPDGDVYFVRANQPEATSWAAPVLVSDFGTPVGAIRLASVAGHPALCWYDRGNGDERLLYVRSDDAQGTSWGVFAPVSPAGNYGSDFDMAVSGANVVVVHAYGSNPAATILRASVLY